MTLACALGPIVAPVLGAWLHERFGWQSCFWFLTAYGLVLLVLLLTSLPETIAHRRPLDVAALTRELGSFLKDHVFVAAALVLAPDVLVHRGVQHGGALPRTARAALLGGRLRLDRPGDGRRLVCRQQRQPRTPRQQPPTPAHRPQRLPAGDPGPAVDARPVARRAAQPDAHRDSDGTVVLLRRPALPEPVHRRHVPERLVGGHRQRRARHSLHPGDLARLRRGQPLLTSQRAAARGDAPRPVRARRRALRFLCPPCFHCPRAGGPRPMTPRP